MTIKSMISNFCLIGWLTLFFVPAAIADTERFDESYDAGSGTVLEIRNRNGSIRMEGWDGNQLRIRAIKRTRSGGKLENVSINVNPGARFSIETLHLVYNPKVSVNYDISVPRHVTVAHAMTANGKIELTRTQGDTDLETSNGRIVVDDVVGNISTSTSNGAIEINRVKGIVRARTSNGAIDVKEVAGVSELETSNGAIDAEVQDTGSNGLRVRTNNGKIRLYLAPDLNVDIEVNTSNSGIELDGIEVIAKEISRNRLRGRIGQGGKKMSCQTSNGAVILGKLK